MNDLISRETLKKAIMNDLGLGDEENGSDAEYMAGLQDCYNLIDNAPTVNPCDNCDLYFIAKTKEEMRKDGAE